jgi:hypothetical protein
LLQVSSISNPRSHSDSKSKAPIIRIPPTIAAGVRGEFKGGGSNWSTIATMKIVRSAATDERTGDVSEIRTRKEPENAKNPMLVFVI